MDYRELTLREAYNLFASGVDVERYWISWMPLSTCYGGAVDWDWFSDCYDYAVYKFRVEVE